MLWTPLADISGYTIWWLEYDSINNVLYVGADDTPTSDSGVWSYDGTTWTELGWPLAEEHTGGAPTTLAYDSGHNLLYVSTGTTWPDSGTGRGVWRYNVATGVWTDIGNNGIEVKSVCSIAYDPNHNILYAGEEDDGMWSCADPDTTPVWTRFPDILPTIPGVAPAMDKFLKLVYDPIHNMLYGGTWGTMSGEYGHGVWRYDGANWTNLGGPPAVIDRYSMYCAVNHAMMPKTWTLEGSNDDFATFDVLDTQTNIIFTDYQTQTFTLSPIPPLYRYYRLNITANGGDPNYLNVWNLNLYDATTGYNVAPAMTANNAPSPHVTSASTEYGVGYEAWNAFDYDAGTFWCTPQYTLTGWLKIYMPSVTGGLTDRSVSALAYDPIDNVLYAGGGYGTDGVYKCQDPDTTPVWNNLNLPQTVNALTWTGTELYAGTYHNGVLKWDGASWADTGFSVPPNDVNSLAYDSSHDLLYVGAGILGGVWSGDVYFVPLIVRKAEKKSAYVSILDPTGSTPLARLTEHFPTTGWTPDIFENLSFESVNRGGYTVASFTIHRPVTQYWADLQYRNQVIVGRGSEIYWEGYISRPIRSIRPDVIEVACLGWSAELNQLWTTADITAPVGGYKMSTFINTVLLADPSTSIVAGTIETGDYVYPEGTRFDFAPATLYFDCVEQLDAGNGYNWGVWGNKAIYLRAKHSSVDWLVWTGDCEDLTISPNPDALCNYALINYTQDGSHYEQVIVQDATSQALYGIIMKKVDVPGKITTAGATQIADLYLASCKDIHVSAEFTCNRIFDSYGAEQYLGKVEGGEVVRIVDWLPTEETLGGVNDIATFEIKSPKYDHNSDTLAITPTEFLPSTDIQIARLQAVGY